VTVGKEIATKEGVILVVTNGEGVYKYYCGLCKFTWLNTQVPLSKMVCDRCGGSEDIIANPWTLEDIEYDMVLRGVD